MIYILGNVPSSKNSKRWTGRMLISSKTVMRYKTESAGQWLAYKNQFLQMIKDKPKPYYIGLYFYRDSKRKADYINIAQIIFDLMQANGWIDNDDMDTVVPVFLGYEVLSKAQAGVRIEVMERPICQLVD